MNFDELLTVSHEIESVLNNRPLTYLSEENEFESLTPNHLIYGRKLNMKPIRINKSSIDEGSNNQKLRNSINNTKLSIEYFMKRFQEEYLATLHEREFYRNQKFKNCSNIKIGDIVLIKEKLSPRIKWKKGKVLKFLYSRDNLIRGVELLIFINNLNKTTKIRRPIQYIVPLELHDGHMMDIQNENIEKKERN